MRQLAIRTAAICTCILMQCEVSRDCRAELTITLTQLPMNRVEISWSGFGTIMGGPFTALGDLDFFDALGISPFQPTIADDGSGFGQDYLLETSSTPLTLTVNPNQPGEVSRTFDTARLDRDIVAGSGDISSDFSLLSPDNSAQLITFGSPYQVSGSATIAEEILELDGGDGNPVLGGVLNFSDLNPGTYDGFTGASADLFGGMTLQIVAASIPEPAAALFGSLVCGVLGLRRGRRVAS
ncbi:MAG: hypothetical protein AAGD11_00765 [Planctomycetota bacterium]